MSHKKTSSKKHQTCRAGDDGEIDWMKWQIDNWAEVR